MKKFRFTAFTVALCTAASTVSYGAVFSDVGSSLSWAESYISSVYESGLMVGDYNSSGQRVFRGTENMTYSEAAQLIYSIVVQSGFSTDITDTGVSKYAMEMSNAGIADWAQKAVAFCMEKGILTSYDLLKFTSGSSDAKITREDMAVYFGKALALSYSVSTGTSLSFNDTYDISSSAKPYVELLNKLGIVSGDDNNNFNPKNNITRAEVAVLASKTFSLMKTQVITNPESGYTQTSGVVVSIYEENGTYVLRLQTSEGLSGFVLTTSTPVYNNATTNVGPTGIGLGDTVTVYSMDSSIAKVVITNDVEVDTNYINTTEYSYTVKDKGELVSAGEYKIGFINKSGSTVYYVVATDAEITLDGKTATLRQLSDSIKAGSLIEVTVELNSSTNEAYTVTAEEQEYTSSTEGKISNINTRKIVITSGSKTYTYNLIDEDTNDDNYPDVTVKYNGSSSSLKDLIEKYDDLTGSKYISVVLTLNDDDEVKKIVATASNYDEDDDDSYTGTIKSIDTSEDEIKVNSKTYDLSSSVRVSITAGSDSITDIDKLEDAVNTGDITIKVELTVKSGKVTRIEGYVTQIEGKLDYMTVTNSSYPRGKMGVTVSDFAQITFSYDEDTTLRFDGTSYDDVNITSLRNSVNGKDEDDKYEVTVKFDEDGIATSVKD
ncbi:MAG: S-layer homology domain-containing protein [Clostridiales bacterium]|nr:S-layer homology domain-containing protein [Clostridiales bacterium]